MNGGDDLAGLFGHFLLLSFLSIGGAITTVPEMHRYLVVERHWLSDALFSNSVAIAQAAPGPNLLFVAVLGWNVGGPLGTLTTMLGILLPSTLISLYATRWGTRRRETRGVRAFTTGMTPLTVGLLFATSWVLALPYVGPPQHRTGALVLIATTAVTMLRTRIGPLWLVAAGAAAGSAGWV